jgi:hypothetical protein
MEAGSWRRQLMDHDSVHDRLRTVRIGTPQEQPVIMADKPGVQRLHPPKSGTSWLARSVQVTAMNSTGDLDRLVRKQGSQTARRDLPGTPPWRRLTGRRSRPALHMTRQAHG